MPHSKLVLLAAAGALAAPPCLAEVVSPAPDAVTVTLYQDGERGTIQDLGDVGAGFDSRVMVSETRVIDVPQGLAEGERIVFRDVADRIMPETVSVEGLDQGAERNFDFDLLSSGALIDQAIGRPVTLVRTDRKSGRVEEEAGVVRSGPDGIVVQTAAGLQALGCSGGAERLVFHDLPGLSAKPTLSMRSPALKPGRHTVTLNYLATGMAWSADYVARINPDGRTLALTGWLTLGNSSGTSFAAAPTSVVAGKLELDEEVFPTPPPRAKPAVRRCWPMDTTTASARRFYSTMDFEAAPPPPPQRAATAVSAMVGGLDEVIVTAQRAQQRDLGDYKLYALPFPTTVAARQIKQVAFLEQPAVKFERIYRLKIDEDTPDDDWVGPEVMLRLQNKAEDGLGKPLPGGVVAVMEPGQGAAVLAGEAGIRNKAVGLPVELVIGSAMDVAAKVRVVDETDAGPRRTRREMEVALLNDKPVPVVLEVSRSGLAAAGGKILRESRRHGLKDGDPLWRIPLKPGEREVLTFVMEAED